MIPLIDCDLSDVDNFVLSSDAGTSSETLNAPCNAITRTRDTGFGTGNSSHSFDTDHYRVFTSFPEVNKFIKNYELQTQSNYVISSTRKKDFGSGAITENCSSRLSWDDITPPHLLDRLG